MADGLMARDAASIVALSSAVAGTAAANRRNHLAFYGNQRADASGFNAASYMNHLRAPARSRMLPNHGPGSGVGIHIHYRDPCRHGVGYGSHYPGDIINSSSDSYSCSRAHQNPQYPSFAASQDSPCGCPRCYWRDFVS